MKTKIPDAVLAAEVSRRGLVKTTAIGGLAMASSALTLPFSRIAHAVDSAIPTKSDEKVIWSACTVNCGSRCPLRMHVVDGEIKYVETDNTGDDNYDGLHQVRACLRGRSMRRRVYNPDRLKYPMKRVGARGEGKFERISWEEAFSRIAKLMKADRDANFIEKNEQGVTVNRWLSTGMLCASGACNETGMLTQKFARSLGMLAVDNQARV